ncbi:MULTISPECIES: RidA family protein [unclassified Variovorax]|uniref:RidA family protein n=1 Tax=unclassified Variovorax TaxID=663243 RepID=UPI0021095E16|nr:MULTISPECIES: RidA family protein [unclassified Variovorax]
MTIAAQDANRMRRPGPAHIAPVPPEWPWEHDMPPAPAVRAGRTVYLSGQLALDAQGRLVGKGDLQAQARQCFDNIEAILARVGGRMHDIVKMTSYFTCQLDARSSQDYWAVRRDVFGGYKPASTGVQVQALLLPDCLLEIEAIAVLPEPAP